MIIITIDDWHPYSTERSEKSLVGCKRLTHNIERNNLTLSHLIKRLNRKTICFFRSEETRGKVIGEFISWYVVSTCMKHDQNIYLTHSRNQGQIA
ncbi:IS1 family transposase [Kistimonas asteriae]|uniref:IS1 family transposase n=1 Tax=Kistimonas asteriae TaxID=517724 RepID=UPI001BAC61D7